MNILILNGSPSGDNSITLQSMLYIQKKIPDHTYRVLNVAQRIRAIERDFSESREALLWAELIVFCYPVYTFLVPAQLHRFIELMKEHAVPVSGKYAVQISTSKHFYDTTAHAFIRENAADLGLRYIEGLSQDMEDLLKPEGQKQAEQFFRHVLWSIRDDADRSSGGRAETGRRIAVVCDLREDNAPLKQMVQRFTEVSHFACDVVNIAAFPFAGGCLGCFHCAADGTCIYKDGFDSFLRDNIQQADATVYAFTIRDHSMGSRFKMFDDRQFCNGHRTVTMGKPVGYLIDGTFSAEPNVRELIEARAEVGGNYFAGIACNETAGVDAAIDHLAANLEYAVTQGYQPPQNFYGVGGLKIFRDLIYTMQGMMREDHRFYKKHGFYDFPQKRKGMILGMYLVGAMLNNPKLSKKVGGNMTKGMLMPYKRVIAKAADRRSAD